MNCKQGDLAVIVRSVTGSNLGKVVRCLSYAGEVYALRPEGTFGPFPRWKIDRELPGWDGVSRPYVFDKNLRPLRDNDGDDETLARASKPEQVTA